MSLRDWIRLAALKTNNWWPFSTLNRLPYRLALRRFLAVCRQHSEIRSVYLRHALTGKQWTPALSDIDLTIILAPNLERARELGVLKEFWLQITPLQAVFPMLGEIEVLSETYLGTWMRFGIEGPGAVHWQLLAGEETRPSRQQPMTARLLLEAFDYAFWFYVLNLTRVFNRKLTPAYLRTQDLLRLKRKIGRCLDAIKPVKKPGEAELPTRPPGFEPDDAGLLLTLLQQLETGLQSAGIHSLRLRGTPNPRQRWLLRQANSSRARNSEMNNENTFDTWNTEIRSIYLDPRGHAYVILRDPADSVENRLRIIASRDYFSAQNRAAVFLTENLFIYLLRFLKPFDHAYFTRQCSLLFGTDILGDIAVPGQAALRHDLLKQTPLLLMFPQSKQFIGGKVGVSKPDRDFALKLEQALALKLLLEHGIVRSSMKEMLEEYLSRYPHQAGEIGELQTTADQPPDGANRLDQFEFFKQLMDDIHDALSTGDAWESVHQP